MKKCTDCNKEINYRAIRCRECDNLNRKIKYKGENNPAFIDGRTLKKYYCLICNKELSCYQTKTNMCQSCENKEKYKNPKNHPNYKDGRSLEIKFCIDCGQEIEYRAMRCSSCETKRRYILGILSPEKTQPEIKLQKLLKRLFHKKYKFVGNGIYWITNFNPDFVNIKNKKIIELYGDYWHNRQDIKEKDKLRIPTYKKYGYKILIVWEHELEDLNELIKKLRKF